MSRNVELTPLKLLTGFLMMSASYCWLLAMAESIGIFLIFRAINLRYAYGFILALSFISIGYFYYHLQPQNLHQLNNLSFLLLMHNANLFSALSPTIFLANLPYALLLAVIWQYCFAKNALQQELSALAQGKCSHNTKKLHNLHKKLKFLTSNNYKNGTLLGLQKNCQVAFLADKDANLHTLAVGTTGSGKTTALCNIVESVITRNLPLFYVDGKGDLTLAHKIKSFAQQHKRKFYLFSLLGNSCAYNPLANGGFTSQKDRIIELRTWSEDHYRKIAEGYLQTVLKILQQTQTPINLYTLAQYLDTHNLSSLLRQKQALDCAPLLQQLNNKESSISSLIAEITNLAQSEIGFLFDCTNKNTVLTLQQALQENAVVYFCLQPLAFPAYASTVGKLIINDIKALAAQQLMQQQKLKIYTIFDEFSLFAGEQIVHLINQGRSAGIHAVLATQSLADISKQGGEELLGQILNNCNNYLIQRQNNPTDAEILANIIGTSNQYKLTAQIAEQNTAVQGSVRHSREFLVHPDDIKRLTRGTAFFVQKQQFHQNFIVIRQGNI